ncbi:hypothetical protein PIB30_006503 [Stylosanthes scabra]|uniref:Aldehyde dehydrogenase domain-containing protein n=1 Tax=Stylosanthes scabra TaxID=79078 RepID=A0ABU6V5S7_9FABA|nr:hypothetical protein [Stylosanthes scabra]
MVKWAELIEENGEELAALDTIDAGLLYQFSKFVILTGATESFRYYAGAADKIHGEVLKCSGQFHAYTLMEPIGVVGHIIPWNVPFGNFYTKVAPSMAAGCTMVLKPAEQTPLSALFAAHLAKLAGVPDGVLNGEVCVAGSRVYVQEGIYDELEKKLVEKAKAWVVGDPFDPKTNQGPQADKNQFDKILSYIEHGMKEGATLLTGGKSIDTKGYFIEPTIFTNVKEDMRIAQDEIFGPVMALMKFKTIEEAIKSANNTRYGLAAGIVTKNIDTANTMSRSIRAGIVWINCYLVLGSDIPFGGFKISGFGGKDFGLDALYKYMQVKSVVTPIYNSPWL